jgi:hypothetical protein
MMNPNIVGLPFMQQAPTIIQVNQYNNYNFYSSPYAQVPPADDQIQRDPTNADVVSNYSMGHISEGEPNNREQNFEKLSFHSNDMFNNLPQI